MSFWRKLFGQKENNKSQIEPIEYNNFLIYQEAQPDSGQYRIAGRITKEVDGELKVHKFIRSDLLSSKEMANELMLNKAKLFIDQNNGEIFK
ncbi:HlyU family transcriptional regulator [Vibrio sp. SS-MA-C1-2]|uniref:HlyU family transcriptional regulator n=1 Tax=Vibrio sp. SS-MA-C1-2 TaxID=2908646 RepID=UPI001F1D6A0A|nr:HlyU family transcriptional regulator [Vibrio sp. SS-MA-C1-2]UJF17321.1 HlyU family transcriptional regulator [Vibrio sp. SS-MA-C1-2]